MLYTNIKNKLKTKSLLLLFGFAMGCVLPTLGAHNVYTVRKVQVEGNATVNSEILIALSGLQTGMQVDLSSGKIRESIQKIATCRTIKSITICLSDVDEGNALATFVVQVEEHPQLADCTISGLTRTEKRSLLEEVTIPNNAVLSPFFIHKITNNIKRFFVKKGFRKVNVRTELIASQKIDKKRTLNILIKKGKKNSVNRIIFEGNHQLASQLLIFQLKALNAAPRFSIFKDIAYKMITLSPFRKGGILFNLPKNMECVYRYFFTHVALFPSIFTEEKYLTSKENLISFYQSQGYRDMRIVKECLQSLPDGKLNLYFKIDEGKQYTIRNIKWIGNYLFSDQQLNTLLDLPYKKIYDPVYITSRLMQPGTTQQSIFDLYTNKGYLFFRADAVESAIEGQQVDLEIRIYEGKQAIINQVNIVGNTITHDKVIRRALLTLPGEKFNKDLMMQSLQNLAMLQLFKVEKLTTPEIHTDPVKGVVDLTYRVHEQPKLNLQLEMGYSNECILKLIFGSNNISIRNLFTGKKPVGEAQNLQLEGRWHSKNKLKDYSLVFKEPWLWLGDHRYIFFLSVNGAYRPIEQARSPLDDAQGVVLSALGNFDNISYIHSFGGRVGLGKNFARNFEMHIGMDYHRHRYSCLELLEDKKKRSGILHELKIDFNLVYDSINHPYFPTRGCAWSNALTLTPPSTALKKAIFKQNDMSRDQEMPRWKEFGTFIMDISFFQRIVGNLILNCRAYNGFLFSPSGDCLPPFERFYLGGTSSTPGELLGGHFIPLRGYPDNSLTPKDYVRSTKGGALFNKFVSELRYPIMLAPACVYVLGFFEMGDTWLKYSQWNLFNMKKSVGGGVRIMVPLPMVPLINLDFGYRLDPVKKINDLKNSFEWHFTLGSSI